MSFSVAEPSSGNLRTRKTHAMFVPRVQKEVDRLQEEIKDLEADLASSRTSENTSDLEAKFDDVSGYLHVPCTHSHQLNQSFCFEFIRKATERERQNLTKNRDQETLAMSRSNSQDRPGMMNSIACSLWTLRHQKERRATEDG
jgi:hypothetical protein